MPTNQQLTDSTKAALCQTALECLCDHGLSRTTVVGICDYADISRGSFNYHYPGGKVDIYSKALEAWIKTISQKLESLNTVEELSEQIIVFFDRLVSETTMQRYFMAFVNLAAATANNDPDAKAIQRYADECFSSTIEHLQKLNYSSEAQAETFWQVFQMIKISAMGYCLLQYSESNPDDSHHGIKMIRDTIVSACREALKQ